MIGKQENIVVSTTTISSHFFSSELGVLVQPLPSHSLSVGLSFIMSKIRELYFFF